MTQASPLTWPQGWPRTKAAGSSQFRTTISGALKNVQESIRKFANDSGKKVENVVISSNVTLGEQLPRDPGVAVYFTWDGISTCICVDRYNKVEDNLQAIHHCIEAERTKLRHGGINLVRAAFRGYAALPPPGGKPWRDVLKIDGKAPATTTEINAHYRRLATERHPDRTGDDGSAMAELNAAKVEAMKELQP